MGKALIVGGGSAGLYTIKALHKREHIEAEIQRIETQLAENEEQHQEMKEQLDLAELEVEEAYWVMNGLIQELYEDQSLGLIDLDALVSEHNLVRSSKGLAALTGVSSLHKAAQDHSRWLAENDKSGHTGENLSTPCRRMLSAGYNWTTGGSCGENVVVGVSASSVKAAMDLWLASAGHRANILNKQYRHIGVGYTRRMDRSIHRHFWVVNFGSLGPGQTASPGSPIGPEYVGNEGALLPLSDALNEAQAELVAAAAKRDKLRAEWATMDAKTTAAQERLTALQAIPEDAETSAWCADFTQDLSGVPATIEIPGEGNQRIIVRPGYSGRAAYNAARDGQLHHRPGMSGPQAYFNAAILPGWQRWMPTYRVGTLTSVDKEADTGSVSLDYEVSSAQSLPINNATALQDVPIEYMNCNAKPFEVGDRVVVEFVGMDWNGAKIIGFESNPKPCGDFLIIHAKLRALNTALPALASLPEVGPYFFGRVRYLDYCATGRELVIASGIKGSVRASYTRYMDLIQTPESVSGERSAEAEVSISDVRMWESEIGFIRWEQNTIYYNVWNDGDPINASINPQSTTLGPNTFAAWETQHWVQTVSDLTFGCPEPWKDTYTSNISSALRFTNPGFGGEQYPADMHTDPDTTYYILSTDPVEIRDWILENCTIPAVTVTLPNEITNEPETTEYVFRRMVPSGTGWAMEYRHPSDPD